MLGFHCIKKDFFVRWVQSCLIVAIYIFCCNSPYAYAQQNIDLQQNEIKHLEETVKLLEDEKQTQKLVKQLNSLLEAKKKLMHQELATKPIKQGKSFNLLLEFTHYQDLFSSKAQAFWKTLRLTASDYQKVKSYFSAKDNLYFLLDMGIKLALAGGIGFLLFLLLKKSTKRWSAKLKIEEAIGFSQKIKAAWLRLLLDIYPPVIIVTAILTFLWLVFPEDAVQFTLVLAALVIYRLALSTVSQVLSPEDIRYRLLSVSDKMATYIFIWSRRLLLFSLWAYIVVTLSSAYGLDVLAFVFSVLYRIGIVAMIALILAQAKDEISTKLFIKPLDTNHSLTLGLKRSYNAIINKLYLWVLLYSSVIVILSILKFEKLWRYLLYSSLKSLLVISVVVGVWQLWDIAFERMFEVGDSIRQRFPGMEEHVNRYVMIVSWLGHIIIILAGFLLILDIWQLNVFALLVQHSDYLFRLVRIPIVLSITVILTQVGGLLIKKFEQKIIDRRKEREDIPDVEIEKQVATVGGILRKAVFITIWVVAILMVVDELGFDIGPALAGAGIFGVALGFGTQNLVRDIISGLFMIAENQIRVGDVAILNGTGGLVIAVNLRTTVLRGLDGTVHVFPNGSINTLSNMTREFSYYIFEVGIAYKEDVDHVIEVLRQLGDEIMQDEEFKPNILEPLEILGLDKFEDSAVIIKARFKTLPIKQWMVGREMNRRIKKRFDELGIEIPFPHRTFYFGDVSRPIDVKIEGKRPQKK